MRDHKLRRDSFFGLHFDFHATESTVVGEVMEPDTIAELLDAVRPDYVQVDTKGHPGLYSYPTRIGTPAPNMRGDILRMWRDATAERGIALFGHHSGLFDMEAARKHPEWAVMDADGNPVAGFLSVFGDYCDQLLIPSLCELALDYGLDGAWVDGECWGVQVDYSDAARRAWAERSPLPPPRQGEEGFAEYLAFCREGFEAYVTHYVTRMHELAPGFEVTSNWIYSSMVPKRPVTPVDFLSGDYTPYDSVNSARTQGRFLEAQGIPWDLMAWGHNSDGMWTSRNRHTKSFVQHAQEASFVMSLGGGFQFYNIQYGGGGTVQRAAIPVWRETAEFVRAREPFCRGARLLPQVGIIAPTEAHDLEISRPFGNIGKTNAAVQGLIGAVQDAGYSSSIIYPYQLGDEKASAFGLMILGEAAVLTEESRQALLSYVQEGGSLLLAAPSAIRHFADEIGLSVSEEQERLLFLSEEALPSPLATLAVDITAKDAVCTGEYYLDNFHNDGPYPAAFTCTLGKGQVTALAFELGSKYTANRSVELTTFLRRHIAALFPHPVATVEGSEYAELTVTERDGDLFVHILNYGGAHEVSGIRSYRELPHPGPVTVRLFLPFTPSRITIEPEGREASLIDGAVVLDRLEIHTILRIEH